MEDSLAAALPAGFFDPEAGLSGDLSRLDVKDLARLLPGLSITPTVPSYGKAVCNLGATAV